MDQEAVIVAIHLYREIERHAVEMSSAQNKLRAIVEQMDPPAREQYEKAIGVFGKIARDEHG